MVIALGNVWVRIPDLDQVRRLMRETQSQVAVEPGCLRYEFAEAVDDPGRFVVVEQWQDRSALERHYRSQAFADYQAAVGKYLTRASELHVHEADAGAMPVDSAPIEPAQDD